MIAGLNNTNTLANNVPNNPEKVISLSKGAKVNLSKEMPGLKKIMFGLGWDVNKYSGSDDFDLDASCFLVGENGLSNPDWFIFYNRLSDKGHYEGSRWIVDKTTSSVIHTGDNRTGAGEGDDEQIYIDLDLVPAEVQKIAITVTIDSAEIRHQSFSMVENAYCRLIDTETNKEVIHFDLGEDFSVETAIVVGEVYRHNGDWKFNAIGRGFSGGLKALCANYGIAAE